MTLRRSQPTGRSLAAGALVAATLALTACGTSESPSTRSANPPIILDTEKVERAIERSSLAQRGKRPRVSCPSGVHQEKGGAFSCTAVVKGQATRFEVTQADGSGRVHYQGQ